MKVNGKHADSSNAEWRFAYLGRSGRVFIFTLEFGFGRFQAKSDRIIKVDARLRYLIAWYFSNLTAHKIAPSVHFDPT